MSRSGIRRRRLATAVVALAAAAGVAAAVTPAAAVAAAAPGADVARRAEPTPVSAIEHFVYLMQGDRTFDNYFGTYPGADGIPAGTCQRLVLAKPANGCVKPFPLHGRAVQQLAPGDNVLDYQYDNGRLDGFVAGYLRQGRDGTNAMGYYDRRDVPYAWAVADHYTLFDHFFSSARHGIRTNRAFWVAAAPQPGGTDRVGASGYGDQQTIFDRLQAAGVSWKFYVEGYNPRHTFRAATPSDPVPQAVRVPLLNYPRFVDNPVLNRHIVDISQYYTDLATGTLPAVSYVASSGSSERSARSMGAGQELIERMVNQLMLSSAWSSSAFLWTYDGSGGWFDHIRPPVIDGTPLGPRVPALLVSPYAPQGRVNHTSLDYTSALKFVEQNWGLRPLTARDARAASLAAGLDLQVPARPPAIIRTDPPPPLPEVRVGPAYAAYLSAGLLAAVLFVAALAGPATIAGWRRREARRQLDDDDDGSVLVGVVMRGEP